jgi:hypothetical protein
MKDSVITEIDPYQIMNIKYKLADTGWDTVNKAGCLHDDETVSKCRQ